MSENSSVALIYARYGTRIFPCREIDTRNGKAKTPYVHGGWHSATAFEPQIRSWWQRWPNAAVGLPCRLNGIIAIDADRHGRRDGVTALSELFKQHGFDAASVPSVSTPRDGRHCLFGRPAELGSTKAQIEPAIDIRDNAYVIAAGSTMGDALRYSLLDGSPQQLACAISAGSLTKLPLWLVAKIRKPLTSSAAESRPIQTGIDRSFGASQRLSALVRKVVSARPGERNATLYWAACRVGELVGLGVISQESALALLAEAGIQAGLHRQETYATARSGVAVGQASGDRRG